LMRVAHRMAPLAALQREPMHPMHRCPDAPG
jgi:hypothetical protein